MAAAPQHRPAYQRFLKRLKEARKEAGLTQVFVGEKLGKNQSWVSKKESGERRMDPVELCEFARIYDAAVQTFLPEFPD